MTCCDLRTKFERTTGQVKGFTTCIFDSSALKVGISWSQVVNWPIIVLGV